ncbi:hypothetical protein [Burkholderia metallica]|uniref:hypothetical protein n=1 Tax=Burkholderia metallica TaxID=488729 RepID=UPI0015769777|nr:hypothetical protein [Burkholderia metallica]NTZ06625.1 hypothetical protein [Burkholderia metallica]
MTRHRNLSPDVERLACAGAVYEGGGVIALRSGEVLHVDAMRIGLTAAVLDDPFPQLEARR